MDEAELQRSHYFPVRDPSHVGEIRRFARSLAAELGFAEPDSEKAALIATEAANNILRHAGSGEILLRILSNSRNPGLELLALDRGEGMTDVSRCLQDGFSTGGTAGTGLGAIRRLSNGFSVFSAPKQGTALLAQVWTPPLSPGTQRLGAVSVAYPGEAVCGDAWAAEDSGEASRFLVADGLGHGPRAFEAAQEAVRVFHRFPRLGPADLLTRAHEALRKTRGAALAFAEIDEASARVRFAGVGNISATIAAPGKSQSLVSHNGTVGQEIRKVQEFVYSWPEDGVLVLHSDGLSGRWELDRYPGLIRQSPSLIAGVLYRDFSRRRDDSTVLVRKAASWSRA